MLISVLIPICNGEQYLRECLNSVKMCPIDEMECIMINDGSEDKTEEICKHFADEDSRFKLINKENTGVSDTRNVGMQKASGKFFFFLDADDYIKPDSWNSIIAHAIEDQCDFVAFSYLNQFSSGKLKPVRFQETNDRNVVNSVLLSTSQLNTCWGKLLRSDVVRKNNISFRKDLKTCEDAIFILDFVQHASKCMLSNTIVLYYKIHSDSVMQTTDIISKIIDLNSLLIKRELYLQANYNKISEQAMRAEFFSILTDLMRSYARKHTIQDISATYKELLNSDVFYLFFAKITKSNITRALKKFEFALIEYKWYTFLAMYFQFKTRF